MKFAVYVLFFSLLACVIKGQQVTGSCGEGGSDSVVYEYNNETFLMIIRGSGNMGSYDLVPHNLTEEVGALPQPPWYDYMPWIGTVVIEEGVTSVGSDAFSQAWNLKSLTLPNSIRAIEYRAFANTGISSLTIPVDVKSIGGIAFMLCKNLKTVTILSDLNSIGIRAFRNCTRLESFTYLGSSTPSCDHTLKEGEKFDISKEENQVFFGSPLVSFVNVPGTYGSTSFCKLAVAKDGIIITDSSSKKEVMMIFTVMLTLATFLVYL